MPASAPETLIDKFAIGTSGWSYKDWVGSFYPDGAAAREWLSHYAREFRAVEVDSTFYGIPRAETVRNWADRTPDGFVLCPKVPSAVTHGARGERPDLDQVLRDEDGELARFLDTMRFLGDKLGPVLFQFPYFRVKEMAVGDFLGRLEPILDRVPGDVSCAVEVRNKSWISAALLDVLRQRRIALAFIDHPYMPRSGEQAMTERLTADFAYVRFLGDRYKIEKTTKTWEKTVLDRTAVLAHWARALTALGVREDVRRIFVFANNHFAGHGPGTCRDFRDALAEEC